MTLNRIATEVQWDIPGRILTVDYFRDGRGMLLRREEYHLSKWVVWRSKKRGDSSEWHDVEMVNSGREKRLETEFQNMLALEKHRHQSLVNDINDILRTSEATDHEALQLKRQLRELLTDEERDE